MHKLLTLGLATVVLALPVAASAQEAYTTRSVNVRGGPDTSYPPVAVLPPGAPVEVMGCLDDWSWCDVVFGYDRGWVYAPYLNYVYQGRRVPFYSYAPSFGIPIVTFSLGPYWDRYYRGRSFYGRRDYWDRNEPRHFRPPGPAPRASVPPFRERSEFREDRGSSGSSGYTGNRGAPSANDYRSNRGYAGDNRPARDAGVPRDRPTAPVAPRAGPAPAPNPAPQEMRRPSPNAAAGPPPGVRGGRGEPSPAPEGNKGRGKDHEGGNEDRR
ncbi:MAG: SH3 domain-containing protein [Pseudomonadota bacterium]|nr:SH3 domain-containing protein [Pseudomonadota bacterium]